MSYMDKINACNNYDEATKVPFLLDGIRVGQVLKKNESYCLDSGIFIRNDKGLTLKDDYKTFDTRTKALKEFAKNTLADGLTNRYMNENYPVVTAPDAEPLAFIDRGIASLLGTLSFGQHLNAYVLTDTGMKMWIGRRAYNKGYASGKLDHLVAGGLPYDLAPWENLKKECYEEAGMPEALALQAKEVGFVSYKYNYSTGGKEDIIYCYDIELTEDFVPHCTDGEVEEFYLMPIEEVAQIVKETNEFKLNCNLVIIDFLVRHGYLGVEEKDYVAIVKGLRQ